MIWLPERTCELHDYWIVPGEIANRKRAGLSAASRRGERHCDLAGAIGGHARSAGVVADREADPVAADVVRPDVDSGRVRVDHFYGLRLEAASGHLAEIERSRLDL